MTEITLTLNINGRDVTRAAPAHYSLLRWLRDAASVFDVKYGCGEGVCGTCGVLVDGVSVSSCIVLAAQVAGKNVTTLVGLGVDGELGPIQEAFVDHGASQCGFCTPGMVLAAHELLSSGEVLDRAQIRQALHGNLCRCTGYQAIVEAIVSLVSETAGSES
ncbi:MAG: (2Fe-2S)-binding protein [Acidimicrobiia bacterium]